MKNILIYIGVLGLVLGGCSDYLAEDNKSNVSADNYYQTSEGFETLVNAAYGSLREVYGGEPYIFCAGTDMYVEGRNSQPIGLSEYRFLSPADEAVEDLYVSAYRSIQTCNMGLHYSELTEDFAALNERIGELKYLRANYFFLLVQTYGGVTLATDFINSPTLEFERNTEAEVYAFIISELEESLNLVASGAYTGRVSKRAVQHLLAKVHLTRGYLDFAASDDFSKAASYADAAIGGQVLDIPFEELWTPGNEANAEVLFAVQYDRGSIAAAPTELGNSQGGYFGPYLGGSEQAGKAPWRSYTLCPTMYFYDQFTEGDSRLDASIMMYIYVDYWDYYNMPEEELASREIEYYYAPQWASSDEQIQAWRDENPAQRSATEVIKYENWETDKSLPGVDYGVPGLKKFDDPEAAFGENTSARDIILARLGETYLLAAEAYFKDGNTGTALARLNEVRGRAAKPGFDLTLAAIDLEVILNERAAELAGEYHRWFDLKRTGTLVDHVDMYNKDVPRENFQGKNGELKILRPIPQSAIDLNQNKNFKQNPAY